MTQYNNALNKKFMVSNLGHRLTEPPNATVVTMFAGYPKDVAQLPSSGVK
jgi:hypothetical protein